MAKTATNPWSMAVQLIAQARCAVGNDSIRLVLFLEFKPGVLQLVPNGSGNCIPQC